MHYFAVTERYIPEPIVDRIEAELAEYDVIVDTAGPRKRCLAIPEGQGQARNAERVMARLRELDLYGYFA